MVSASDNAGNGAASAPVVLVDRSAPAPTPTPRTASEAVLLRKGGASRRAPGRAAGDLVAADPTTVDLRPLALGKGSFQFVFKIKSGKKTKTFTKTQTSQDRLLEAGQRQGARRVPHASVTLTVARKSGKRWVTHATASTPLCKSG